MILCVKDANCNPHQLAEVEVLDTALPTVNIFKSSEEMKSLFKDIPESILNIKEIIDKVESYELKREVLLPAFDIPNEFIDAEDEKDIGKRGEMPTYVI